MQEQPQGREFLPYPIHATQKPSGQLSPFPGHAPENYTALMDDHWDFGRYTLAVSLILLSIITVFGNALILFAITTSRALRHIPFSIFLANMAFTDLLVGAILDTLWGIYSVYGSLNFNSEMACHIYLSLEYLISFSTPSSLAVIAFDRVWEARWPVYHLRHCKRKCAALCVLVSWLYPILLWSPIFIWDRLNHPYESGDCFFDHGEHANITYLLAVFGYVIPILLALFCYFAMAYTIYVSRVTENEETAAIQRDRLTSMASANQGIIIANLSLFIQQPLNDNFVPPDNTSEVSTVSDVSEINDIIFFKNFRDDELGMARFEHHLERRSFYLLTLKLAIYLLSWSPYFFTFFSAAGGYYKLPPQFVTFSVWNTYISAAVNPMLTILSGEHVSIHIQHMMNSFRHCLVKRFTCKQVHPSTQQIGGNSHHEASYFEDTDDESKQKTSKEASADQSNDLKAQEVGQ